MADADGHAVRQAIIQPTDLVVLQLVAGTLHLDQLIALFRRPEADQVRQAGTVGLDVGQQALEHALQVSRRHAIQRQRQQQFGQRVPGYEGRLQALLVAVAAPYLVAILRRVQQREAGLELRGAARRKIGRAQVGGTALERMEECARHRREHRRPAQQAEQRVEQRVLDIVRRRLVAVPMVAHGQFHRQAVRRPGQHQIATRRGAQPAAGGRGWPSARRRRGNMRATRCASSSLSGAARACSASASASGSNVMRSCTRMRRWRAPG